MCNIVQARMNYLTSACRARIATIMAGRPRTPEGEKIRDTILVYLRRLELVNAPKPTFREIGALIERTHRPTIDYLRSMRGDGLITWVDRQPRTLSLTETGRARADLLLSPHIP